MRIPRALPLSLTIVGLAGAMSPTTAPALVESLRPGGQELSISVTLSPTQNEFPVPTEGLTIPDPFEWTLLDLIVRYTEITGQNISWTPQVQNMANQVTMGLTTGQVIPPESVHSFVEHLLSRNGFLLTIMRASEPRLLAMHTINDGSRQQLRRWANYVPESELSSYRDHPAHLIQTMVHLESLDVRTTVNSLRATIIDSNIQQLLPLESAGSIVLVGPATQVLDMVALLRDANEKAREDRARRAKEAEDARAQQKKEAGQAGAQEGEGG